MPRVCIIWVLTQSAYYSPSLQCFSPFHKSLWSSLTFSRQSLSWSDGRSTALIILCAWDLSKEFQVTKIQWPKLDPVTAFALQSCSSFHIVLLTLLIPLHPLIQEISSVQASLCLLALYLFPAQNLYLTHPVARWHCRRFAQINITFLHLPQGKTVIKSRRASWLSQPHHDLKLRKARFCISAYRDADKYSKYYHWRASEMIQKYCHTSSQSHYWCVCTFVILASFVVLSRAISCLCVVSLCFILLIENSLWVNAWRNESWMMCGFALVNLLQSLA